MWAYDMRTSRDMGLEHGPSEEMEAPESLKSSDPICIGKTRSCGKILGILDIS